ncbi:MAG: DUF1361 domain-containing protein [Spirosomataceae bacterium]
MPIFPLSPFRFRVLVVLGLMSGLAVLLSVVRLIITGNSFHVYLGWNLFLGWIPVFLALWVEKQAEHRWKVVAISCLWLLFLPNSPYIITDLIHLRPGNYALFWHDVVMIFTYAFVSLVCGLISLYWIQKVWTKAFSERVSFALLLAVFPLTGYGIYLGRVQRWNSWDVLVDPKGLVINALRSFRSTTAWVITIEFALLMAMLYWLMTSLLSWRKNGHSI